jgi:hypothetical protein
MFERYHKEVAPRIGIVANPSLCMPWDLTEIRHTLGDT